MYKLCPPSYLIDFGTALDLYLNLYWIGWGVCTTIEVRDIYRMEFEVFLSLGWVLSYLAAVVVFGTRMCLGWQKVVLAPGMDIPKLHQTKAIHIGYIMTIVVAMIYASFPIFSAWSSSCSTRSAAARFLASSRTGSGAPCCGGRGQAGVRLPVLHGVGLHAAHPLHHRAVDEPYHDQRPHWPHALGHVPLRVHHPRGGQPARLPGTG